MGAVNVRSALHCSPLRAADWRTEASFCSTANTPYLVGQYLIYSDDHEPEWLGLLQGVKSIIEQSRDALDIIAPAPTAEGVTKEPVNPETQIPGVEKALQVRISNRAMTFADSDRIYATQSTP